MLYQYYFVRVADKQQADFPARVEIDISKEWYDILHELDKEEHANDEYQRRLSSCTTKNPARFAKPILGPEEAFFQKEREEQLTQAMDKLTPRQLFLVEAVVVDGRSKVSVAKELNVYEGAVRKQLLGALKKLRKKFSIN